MAKVIQQKNLNDTILSGAEISIITCFMCYDIKKTGKKK